MLSARSSAPRHGQLVGPQGENGSTRLELFGPLHHDVEPNCSRSETACPANTPLFPGIDPSRVLMFFHGGGYCSGSIKSHRRLVTEAGRAAKIRTVAVGYRLAPEHPFPAVDPG